MVPVIVIVGLIIAGTLRMYYMQQEFNVEASETLVSITGTTFGTVPYNIQYLDANKRDFKAQIDSLLREFNQCLSTYIATSEINKFNETGLIRFERPFFYPVLDASRTVYDVTGGAFDPTVGPLINAWGFGPTAPIYPDSSTVDSLLEYVNFDSVYFNKESVCRLKPGIELSFSAIAKGQGVDVVADFLNTQGIENVFVEIGGEVVARGHYLGDRPWIVGIEDPTVTGVEQKALLRMTLENQGLATSGNYRNFYIHNGRKYAHTIDPKTGYPVQHSLLSATVMAKNCMLADAYATAFMVLGVEESQRILEENDDLEAILVYSQGTDSLSTFFTAGIRQSLLD